MSAWRSRLVLTALAVSFAILGGRAFYLQRMNDSFLQAKGTARYSRLIEVPANRGRILDRGGEPLAVSTPVKSIWAIPTEVQSGARLGELARLLEMPLAEVQKRLAGSEQDFVYLKRQVPPLIAERVAELKLTGVFQNREYRRYYPGGEVMAHMLGFTGVDDVGQEGMELAFQSQLAGKPGTRRVIRDRLGRVVDDPENVRPAEEGRDLQLALDSRIQNIAYRFLKQAVEAHRARAGSVIVLDVRTGEVLALANLPTYNPNNRSKLGAAQVRNRVVTDTFEPGSTLKPFTVALAIDSGKVKPDTRISTAPGTFTIGSATIRDAHPYNVLSVAEVIQKSSNVGAAKIALGLAPESMWRLFDEVGFGSAPRLGFPGEAPGKVRPYKTWKPIEQATMSYGHGIAVSLAQLARAYTMFARDGDIVPLSLIRVSEAPQGKQVISANTAREMRRMLEMAVQPTGTAPRAQVMGYRVGGKTGTAHKQENGGYAHDKYISSFVGLAPVSEPRVVVAVMIDEPHDGQYYGGAVAAPVFASIMEGALKILSVAPDAPMKPIELPPPGLELKENL